MWNFRKSVLESSGTFTDQRTHAYWRRSDRERWKKKREREKNEWVLKCDPGIRSRKIPLPILLLSFRGKMSAGRTKSRDRSSTRNPVWEENAQVISRSRTCESVKLVRSPSILLSTRILGTSMRGFVKKSSRAPWIFFAIWILMLHGH